MPLWVMPIGAWMGGRRYSVRRKHPAVWVEAYTERDCMVFVCEDLIR